MLRKLVQLAAFGQIVSLAWSKRGTYLDLRGYRSIRVEGLLLRILGGRICGGRRHSTVGRTTWVEATGSIAQPGPGQRRFEAVAARKKRCAREKCGASLDNLDILSTNSAVRFKSFEDTSFYRSDQTPRHNNHMKRGSICRFIYAVHHVTSTDFVPYARPGAFQLLHRTSPSTVQSRAQSIPISPERAQTRRIKASERLINSFWGEVLLAVLAFPLQSGLMSCRPGLSTRISHAYLSPPSSSCKVSRHGHRVRYPRSQ